MDIAECLFLRRSTFRITKTRGINRRIVFFDLMAMLFDCDEQERIKGSRSLSPNNGSQLLTLLQSVRNNN